MFTMVSIKLSGPESKTTAYVEITRTRGLALSISCDCPNTNEHIVLVSMHMISWLTVTLDV